jgi:CubicO group peptidase (beta-lactamase class C family)
MEKRQFRVLYQQFLFRMVDLEVLSSHAQGDSNRLVGQFASLLIFLSIILSFGALGGPRTARAQVVHAWSMEHLMISTTMLVVGLFAVLSWDSMFPNRGDVMVLAPLPVRTRTLFLAKVSAVAMALGLTVACVQAVAGVAYPLGLGTQGRPDVDVPALTLLPAEAPASVADLERMLQRDLAPAVPRGVGVSVGVYRHGERRVFAYGAAKPDSIYQIASVTKTFTGLLLAQMAVEGQVRLEEPLRDSLPSDVPGARVPQEIRLLDLAIHRSGLPPVPPNLNPQNLLNPAILYHASDLWAALRRLGVARPASPEAVYSNFGYGVLGEALALRAGVPFAELMAAKVTGALGLRDTTIGLKDEQEQRLLPAMSSEGVELPNWYFGALDGAGGLRSTGPDMLAYLEANLREATPALKLQHRLRAGMGPSGMKVALGWMYDENTGAYFHNGVISGYTSHALFHPAGDYAVVVLVNQAPSMLVFADVVARHIRQRLAGAPATSLGTIRVPGSGGFLGLLRFILAYWAAMVAAGAFLFCCVLGLQGLAAQMLPRRMFLRVSSALQLGALCTIVCVYFIQPTFVTGDILMNANGNGALSWSPSYWFLGLMQQLLGSPAMAPLARRAWIGLSGVVMVTAAAYALSYLRTLRQIVETPDILPGARRGWRLPLLGVIEQFSVRTVMRSRQHRIVLAFYVGIGFALTILLLKSPTGDNRLPDAPATDVSSELMAPILGASIIMLIFAIIGTRLAFAMPKDLRANWVFRVCVPPRASRELPSVGTIADAAGRSARATLLLLAGAPVLVVTAAVAFRRWPLPATIGHLIVLALLASILCDVCLYSFHKIPFTCSYLPGKSRVHMAFLYGALLLYGIMFSVRYERDALLDIASMAPVIGGLLVIAIIARWLTSGNAKGAELLFEEEDSSTIQTLGIR